MKVFKDDFKKAVATGEYIGTGNPNANILIIGCECAVDKDSKQEKEEVIANVQNWQENIDKAEKGINIEITDNCSSTNPLYPYKGQKLKMDNGQNCGTSRTWFNYQKLCNMIFDSKDEKNNNTINFHERFFLTEFSTITSQSKKAIEENNDRKKLRQESIKKRADLFHQSAFFNSFPIIIVATGGAPYVDNKNVKLWEIFNVDYKEEESGKEDKIYYHIHRNKEGQTPQLIIHTWQFAANISNKFLGVLSKLCKDFLIENGMEL